MGPFAVAALPFGSAQGPELVERGAQRQRGRPEPPGCSSARALMSAPQHPQAARVVGETSGVRRTAQDQREAIAADVIADVRHGKRNRRAAAGRQIRHSALILQKAFHG